MTKSTGEDDRWSNGALAALGKPVMVTVERTVLADILEQIEETFFDHLYSCGACGGSQDSATGAWKHRSDCRYVRVRDYLKGLGL